MSDTRSEGEALLAFQLKHTTSFRVVREFQFAKPRRWRYDFLIGTRENKPDGSPMKMVLVDIDGGMWTGGHSRGLAYEKNAEKHNEAAIRGFSVLRVTPPMVKDLRALKLIERALAQ